MMDYFDYSPAASLMTYGNDLNASGVTIDGAPDAVIPGELVWEMVTGAQGTMAMTTRLVTDIPAFTYTSYYSDDLSPPATQCTGDDYEYGASGLWVDHGIPNTDPALGAYYIFEATKSIAYGSPGEGVDLAEALSEEIDNPLIVEVAPYVPTGVAGGSPDDALTGRVRFSPNPASGTTRICFAQAWGGRTTVDLFDASGRFVARVLDEWLAAGVQHIECDLSEVPAGIYFARADGPNGRRTSRVVVLR
jgi:hypothetical protein